MIVDRLLPVLRNLRDDVFSRNGLHRVVAPGLAVFLAEVAPTLTNTLGIEYVLRNQSPEKTGTDDQLFDIAFKNLIMGLRVDVIDQGHGQCYRLHRAGACGAAAIALPDFFKMASSWCGTQEMLVYIEDVSHVWVAARHSQMAGGLQEKLRIWRSAASVIDLDPVCLILREGGFEESGDIRL